MIGGEPRGRPLRLHSSGQTPEVKGLQSAYMETLFGTCFFKLLLYLRNLKQLDLFLRTLNLHSARVIQFQ